MPPGKAGEPSGRHTLTPERNMPNKTADTRRHPPGTNGSGSHYRPPSRYRHGMPAKIQCAANIRFTTTAREKRSHKNPFTNRFRSPGQERNPVTGHLHATGLLQRQNTSRDFRTLPTCRRRDGHIVRQIRCFLSPFFATRGNASGNDRPAAQRRPVTLCDGTRPFPSYRHPADETVPPPLPLKKCR